MSSTALVRPAVQAISTPNTLTRQTSSQSPVATPNTRLPSLTLTPQTSKNTAAPASSPATYLTPSQCTPGQWQHPRMNEVIRRQSANHFDSGNVRAILGTVGALALSLAVKPVLAFARVPNVARSPYTEYTLTTIRLLLLLAIAISSRPLWRAPDTCEDIPLSAPQRHALGLPPMSRPSTPQEEAQYVTPPRYSRSNSPSVADSIRAQARGSPLSGRGSPLESSSRASPSQFSSASSSVLRRQNSGSGSESPYSHMSDRLQQSSSANDLLRRSSFGSGSPRREPDSFERLGGSPGGLGKSSRASVGLNSKWLYQKGRASPTPNAIGSGWGTGSVFN